MLFRSESQADKVETVKRLLAEGKPFTEDDWNEQSSLDRNPYYFSKAMAERAAWAFVGEEHPGFDLVAINPYLILGPSLGAELNTTNAIFRDLLTGVYPGVLNLSWGFVDVRDVALAHALALESPAAAGRYVCAGETLSMREVVELLRQTGYDRGYKLPRLDLACAVGDFAIRILSYTQPTGLGSYMRTHIGKVMRYDNSKIRRDLGLRFRPARDSVLETVADLVRWGHVPAPAAAG